MRWSRMSMKGGIQTIIQGLVSYAVYAKNQPDDVKKMRFGTMKAGFRYVKLVGRINKMIDLDQFKNRTPGKWTTRKYVDYPRGFAERCYKLEAHYKKGETYTIGGMLENPIDAQLCAAAPDLLKELEEARAEIKRLNEFIKSARDAI